MKSHKEYLKTQNEVEIWGSRYSWESWIVKTPTIDTRTNKLYSKGDIIFALISYIDDYNKIVYVNELQYFKKLDSN